jgi:hypothetical protein
LREIALHVLDLIENAVRAGASVIAVSLEEDPAGNLLTVAVEDNGPGLPVSAEIATDPFFTTKEGKKTGLGLSLLKFRAEQAGGEFRIAKSCLGGVAVRASMPMTSVDRSPLGDLGATLASVVCTTPEIELRARLVVGGQVREVSTADVRRSLPNGSRGPIPVARRVREIITEGMAALHVTE